MKIVMVGYTHVMAVILNKSYHIYNKIRIQSVITYVPVHGRSYHSISRGVG